MRPLEIFADDGVATLQVQVQGRVGSGYERQSATGNALEGGAYRARNRARVRNRARNRLEVAWGPQSQAP